jgi:hypothetical protein
MPRTAILQFLMMSLLVYLRSSNDTPGAEQQQSLALIAILFPALYGNAVSVAISYP